MTKLVDLGRKQCYYLAQDNSLNLAAHKCMNAKWTKFL